MTDPRIDPVIDEILTAEGGFSDDPTDPGGRTDKGISEAAHPKAWEDGKVTTEEARAIYEDQYVKRPGFDQIPDTRLLHHLVDFGVTSGPTTAIRHLQTLLGVEVDGILGPETLQALSTVSLRDLSNHLMCSRLEMIGRILNRDKSQVRFALGWIRRAISFLRTD